MHGGKFRIRMEAVVFVHTHNSHCFYFYSILYKSVLQGMCIGGGLMVE